MKKYRVIAKTGNEVYIDVEAETPEKAMDIASDTDGWDFQEIQDSCFWNITEAIELEE